MAQAGPSAYRLVDRPEEAALFLSGAEIWTTRRFVAAAHAMAEALPDAPCVVNLCRDRRRFALGFAAAVLRRQPTLLSSDRSPARLRDLSAAHPGATILDDDGFPGTRDQTGPADNPEIDPEWVAATVFTSGSTGQPVGHRKTFGALADRSRAAGERFGLSEADPATVVGTVPPQHMYGFETTVLLPFHAAAASWCGTVFYPDDMRTALAAAPGRRVLVTTPLQLRALLQAEGATPRIHAVISATAPLDLVIATEAERALDTIVFEIFGATEVGSIASRRTAEGDAWTAYPDVTLHGGADGSMSVSARHASAFPLGDVVERLDERRFRVLGRHSDLVKLAGRRASLAGLTAALTEVEGVLDALFVAPNGLDQRPTARLMAFAVAPGCSPERILASLRDRIDPVFLPRKLVLLDRLPRNEVGKLTREAVETLLAAPGSQ